MTDLPPELERRRVPAPDVVQAPATPWAEHHRLLVDARPEGTGPDGHRIVVVAGIGRWPHRGRAAFQAAVLIDGRPPLVIAEDDIAEPVAGWEIRASGLWADQVCEDPFVHWSYGLEAFALAIDDPAALLDRAHGVRLPLGWELEFESTGPPTVHPDGEGYDQDGIGHGLLLMADERWEIEGRARRSHRWGTSPVTADERVDDHPGGRLVALPTPAGVWWVGPSDDGVRSCLRP
ncbi:MAG: hypothetical protein ACFCVK_05005 [Acidimicrobiales bacterium]